MNVVQIVNSSEFFLLIVIDIKVHLNEKQLMHQKLIVLFLINIFLKYSLFAQLEIKKSIIGDWSFNKIEFVVSEGSFSSKENVKMLNENKGLVLSFNKDGKYKRIKVFRESDSYKLKYLDSGIYELNERQQTLKTNGQELKIIQIDKDILKLKVDKSRILVFNRLDINKMLPHEPSKSFAGKPIVIDIHNAKEHGGEFVQVCATVYDIKETNDYIFVDLGGHYPHQLLSLAIRDKAKAYFHNKKFKNICVSGKIVITGNLIEIPVVHYNQIVIRN